MKKLVCFALGLLVLTGAGASAQSVAARVTGAVGGATAGTSATAGIGGSSPISGVSSDSFGVPASGIGGNGSTGGDLAGGLGMKVGDKVVTFRGAVGVGDDRSNARIGAGIPF
jgi:hypothetical protein